MLFSDAGKPAEKRTSDDHPDAAPEAERRHGVEPQGREQHGCGGCEIGTYGEQKKVAVMNAVFSH